MRRHRHHHHAHHAHAHHGPHGPHCQDEASGARAWWFRVKLRRRLFWWFGITIAVTVLMTGGLARVLRSDVDHAPRDRASLESLVGALLPAHATREELSRVATAIAREMHVTIEVTSTDGAPLARAGGACERAWLTTRVDDGARAHVVTVCGEERRPGRAVALFVVGLLCLWSMAGLLARRLARPLEDVARVATSIAEGDLSARARVDRRVRGEARALAETVNAMASRIEQQLADQKELLAAVSHELRTPLGHLAILADTLEDLDDDGARRAEIAGHLRREVAELDSLVDELLASARLDFKNVARVPLDLVELARLALERKGQDTSKVRATTTSLVQGDRALLGRAAANLVENALRHGGGVHEVKVDEEAGFVTLTVTDRGPGFPNVDDDALFAPFQQGPSSTKRGGLGLGLSLVRRIAAAHGGRAFAKNGAEGGAQVGIAIPVSAPSSS